MVKLLLSCLLALTVQITSAKVVLPSCLTDNMVLQQKTSVNLWGTQSPGTNLTIITSWNNSAYHVHADANGNWKVKVTTPGYGGPYTITFNDGSITALKNILIGEVWVCSGQSNMEMQLSGFYGDVLNLGPELADAANYPEIRMLTIDHQTSFTPLADIRTKSGWIVCNPQTMRDFSAVAYFFARNLFAGRHIPICRLHRFAQMIGMISGSPHLIT
jgi:sialate O-acetylesterase